MNILFLSFYFEPDLSAGSFRNTALVDELKRLLPEGSHIDVLTTLPNRYAGYTVEASAVETQDFTSIKRIALPSHESGMLDQSKAFWVYAKAVRRHVAGKRYDMVYASSSRLMTAFLGASVSQQLKVPLYLDIRDIFVDTIKDVLPRKIAWLMKPLFSLVERYTIKNATVVNVVSEGFVPYFKRRYPHLKINIFTNGIDDEFIRVQSEISTLSHQYSDTTTVLYAGNIGEGQGLHYIIPELAKNLGDRVEFRLIGGGGKLNALQVSLNEANIQNVQLVPPVKRAELIKEYRRADVLFLHLNDYDAFKKVLPSKLFEYGAMGKPILAGVGGYAAEFVRKHIDNAEVFEPCNVEEGIAAFNRLKLITYPRYAFVDNFSRKSIMEKMAEMVINVGASDG